MNLLDPSLLALLDEVRRRVESVKVDVEEAERIAAEILKNRGWEEALALLASIAARVLARVSASWEHPCHCEPRRVAGRASLLCLVLAQVINSGIESLARSACQERSRDCVARPTSIYT